MALPELYKEQEFQRQTFDRNSEFMKHNPNLTARGTRKFNRYWNSDQRLEDEKAFNAAQDAAEVAHIEAEAKKRAESWDARIAALKEQNAARGAAALKSINASLAAKPVVPASKPAAAPVAKTLTPRSEADWNRIASEATNGQLKTMADVEAWQRANGFSEDQIDGKFGNYSRSYFTSNGLGKYKAAPLDESSPEFIGPVLQPKSDTDSTPQTKPIITESQFRNSKYFRGVHGMIPDAAITVEGKKYPIMATTGLYGNNMGLTNDHTYAYDPETGKIRKVYENFMGMPFNQFDHGSEWIDPSTLPLFNKQGGKMNRINYFQQGGAAPQQDIQQQVVALVQAAMQGDQKATETVNKIMEAAKAGDQQAMQIAQLMEQVIKQMKSQATHAKWGTKLSYLQALKCGGPAKKKMKKGAKVCPECEKEKIIKKNYFGGSVDKFGGGGETKQSNKKNLRFFDRRSANMGNNRRVITETVYDYDDGLGNWLGDFAKVLGTRTIYETPQQNDTVYSYTHDPKIHLGTDTGYMGVANQEADQNGAKTNFLQQVRTTVLPENQNTEEAKARRRAWIEGK